MEDRLLVNEKERIWKSIWEESKKISTLSTQLIVVSVAENLIHVISVMMVGYLGPLMLSSVAIATSLTNITGYTLLFGMAGALETLCGQYYGAGEYQKVGAFTYCSIICFLLICIPISCLWMIMDKILLAIGQDPQVATIACEYAIWLIPDLLGSAILQSLIRYYQSQSICFPMFISSLITLALHVPLCWVLVYKIELGIKGAAISMSISSWLNTILLSVYMRYSTSCEKTRAVSLKDVYLSVMEFFSVAIPSSVMICLEWWSYELLILMSGFLPDTKLVTAVLSICLTSTSLHYHVPYGFSAATSTRISNKLGAGNAMSARVTVIVSLAVTLTEAVITSLTLLWFRDVFGYLYTNDKELVDNVSGMTPLLCLSILMDSLLAVLSGVARGTGWQSIAAYVNLGAYYLVGIPVAILLSFVYHFGEKGLWIGLLLGSTLQALVFLVLTIFTDWQDEGNKAKERIRDKSYVAPIGLA